MESGDTLNENAQAPRLPGVEEGVPIVNNPKAIFYDAIVDLIAPELPPMDPSKLAALMLEWEQAKRQADALETRIKREVLNLGKSQTVGNVRATYSKGRRTFDYQEGAGESVDPYVIEMHTKPRIDWRGVCNYIGRDKDEIPFTQGQPSVSVKLT